LNSCASPGTSSGTCFAPASGELLPFNGAGSYYLNADDGTLFGKDDQLSEVSLTPQATSVEIGSEAVCPSRLGGSRVAYLL